jgi:uncharacterized protein YdhG (YjbR/CyaY superfamily)
MATPKIPFPSIDDYIASFPEATQKVLAELRATIQSAAPEADEKISYDMPTFTFHGRLIYFAAWKKHIAVYGIPASTLDALKEEVAPYKTEKGALIFPFTQPLPLALITQIVQLGVAKNLHA